MPETRLSSRPSGRSSRRSQSGSNTTRLRWSRCTLLFTFATRRRATTSEAVGVTKNLLQVHVVEVVALVRGIAVAFRFPNNLFVNKLDGLFKYALARQCSSLRDLLD